MKVGIFAQYKGKSRFCGGERFCPSMGSTPAISTDSITNYE
jgi:hypothetical protein